MKNQTPKCLIVGAGCAGASCAATLAEAGFDEITVIDRRKGVGGNAYDCLDEYGVLIHPYGPHIFHTEKQDVYDFISRFTQLNGYQHKVAAKIGDQEIPVPFNLNSLKITDPDHYEQMRKLLCDTYGMGCRVSIVQLRKADDSRLRQLADYVYENVFRHYTYKQWGTEQVDETVLSRVPVLISQDDRYFQDHWQGLPNKGYTAMFESMLDWPGITVKCNQPAAELTCHSGMLYYQNQPFDGIVVYTGALDELFDYCYGILPYRTLDIVFTHYQQDKFQSHATVNYTVSENFTRISEFKQMTGQQCDGTTVAAEYSLAYDRQPGKDPYYPIVSAQATELYQRYRDLADQYPKLHLAGRLAEYRYYNMDAAIAKGIQLAQQILEEQA
jgi:UDP-galactopyranose mutase